MQLTVNLPDEVAAEAQARGLSPESFVETLVVERIGPGGHTPESPRDLSLREFDAALDQLAAGSRSIPALPDEAFHRASFYEERD
jgi:hypothetical protein